MPSETTTTHPTQDASPLPLEVLGSPPDTAGSGAAYGSGGAPEPMPLELLHDESAVSGTHADAPTPLDGPSAEGGSGVPSPMSLEELDALR